MTATRLTSSLSAGLNYIERHGDGARTVILLHGIGGRASIFEPVMAAWPPGERILAVDLPGYGGSKPLPQVWPRATDYAAAIDAFRAELNIARFGVVGHSLGCLIAGSYAVRYSGHVRKLALMAPALGYKVAVGGVLPANVANRLVELERLGPTRFAAERAGSLVAGSASKPDAVASVEAAMAAVSLAGYRQAVHMLASGDLAADAAHASCPVLILNGDCDFVTPLLGAQALQRAFCGRAELVVISGAGHAVSVEQPAHVARLIATFLEAA